MFETQVYDNFIFFVQKTNNVFRFDSASSLHMPSVLLILHTLTKTGAKVVKAGVMDGSCTRKKMGEQHDCRGNMTAGSRHHLPLADKLLVLSSNFTLPHKLEGVAA